MPALPRPSTVIAFPRTRLTDAELVHAVAAGDHEALAVVWERYAEDVRTMLRSCLGPDSAIDDLVQEVFVAFYRNAKRLDEPRALRSYLLGIAVRASAFELRTRKRRFRWLSFSKTGTLPDTPAAESPIGPRDALRALRQLLERVPELARMAFMLRYAEDLSPQEVALALEVSEAKARRAITDGRARVLASARKEPALVPYLSRWLEEA